MTSAKTAALIFSPLVIALVLFSFMYKNEKFNKAETGFALIELFTSEGCSSCPPADGLVAKINAEMSNKPVYILAYHVDYWDRLGWKDPYSSAGYTKRQNEYAERMNLQSIYTPQIVVNGQTELVGSDESKLRQAIKGGFQKTAVPLLLHIDKLKTGQATIGYSLPAAGNTALYIACVQKKAQMKVERGENGGRTLSHINVVRSLDRLPAGTGRTETVKLPPAFNSGDWELIGFVQNTATGEITAAAQLKGKE
jgi:hypothetical protein